MATIPLGDFGQRVAQPTALRDLTIQPSMGDAMARGGAAIGAQIMRNQDLKQAEQQRQADIQQNEQRRLQLEQEREAKQAAAEALRSKAIVTQQVGEDDIADIKKDVSDGVKEGRYKPDEAEKVYNERARKVLTDIGQDLPEDKRTLIQSQLTRSVLRGGNDVKASVTERNRSEVTANIKQGLEGLQRRYLSDPDRSTANAMLLLDELGPSSSMNPEMVATLRQQWKETTQYTAGFSLVSMAKDDRKALAAAEKAIRDGLPDMDPQKKVSLLDRIDNNRLSLEQRAEVAAQRAQREAERRLSNAKAEIETLQVMADKGTLLDPAYVERVMQATAGTPYQAAVKQMSQVARDTGGLAAQPVRSQQMALDQVNALIAKQGRSPELDKRKAQIEGVLRGSQQDLERDGLRAGLERGVIEEIKPLDMSGGIPGMLQQLQQRAPMAQRVSMWAGRSVSPMTDDEAGMLKQQLDSLPAKERSGMVAALAAAVGPQGAQGLAAQIDKKDKALSLAFALAGSSTTNGRYTSELVLKGAQAKSDGTSTKGEKQPDVKAAAWRTHAATELDGVFGNQQTTTQIRDAAEFIMHGIAAEQGGRLTKDDMTRAVNLAIGGELIEHNGRRIPLPAGVDESALQKRLSSVSPEEVTKQASSGTVRAGGALVPVAEFVKTLPGQPLMPVSKGRFAVLVNGRPVTNEAGDPIVIGVR